MGMAFKIMAFVLLFNICSGILNVTLIEYYPNGVPTGYQYNESGDALNNFKGAVTIPPASQLDTTWFNKFTDFIRLGFFQKIQTFLDTTIYGLVGIFKNIGLLPDSLYWYFYSIMTIIYVFGIVDLFTGKKVQY